MTTTTNNNQQTVQGLIELLKSLPLKDLEVVYTPKWDLSFGNVRSHISVYSDKFYDRICGNGWMHENHWCWTFDADTLAYMMGWDAEAKTNKWSEPGGIVDAILDFVNQKKQVA